MKATDNQFSESQSPTRTRGRNDLQAAAEPVQCFHTALLQSTDSSLAAEELAHVVAEFQAF